MIRMLSGYPCSHSISSPDTRPARAPGPPIRGQQDPGVLRRLLRVEPAHPQAADLREAVLGVRLVTSTPAPARSCRSRPARAARPSLCQAVADANLLAAFSAGQDAPERFAGADREAWTAVLDEANRAGLLTRLGSGMYRMHPALPGYLAAHWPPGTRTAMRRAGVEEGELFAEQLQADAGDDRVQADRSCSLLVPGRGLDGAMAGGRRVWSPADATVTAWTCSRSWTPGRDPSRNAGRGHRLAYGRDCLLSVSLWQDSAGVFMHELLERGEGGADWGRAWMSLRMWRARSR